MRSQDALTLLQHQLKWQGNIFASGRQFEGTYYGVVVQTDASTSDGAITAGNMTITIPNLSGAQVWGPLPYPGTASPPIGTICTLTFNTNNTPIVHSFINFGGGGAQGAPGAQGPQGYQGLTGPQGTQGVQGPTGIQGSQGTQGLTGPQGTQGTQGNQGNQGPQGYQGYQGITGSQGTQGIVTTNTGIPPTDTSVLWLDQTASGNGTQGPQGAPGTNGATTLSSSVGSVPPSFWSSDISYQNFDPYIAQQMGNASGGGTLSITPSPGVGYYLAIYFPATFSPSKITFYCLSSNSATGCFIGLYNSTTQIGITSAFNPVSYLNTQTITATTTGSLTNLSPGVYYVAFLVPSSSSSPSIFSNYGMPYFAPATTANSLTTIAQTLGSGLSSLPSSISGTPSYSMFNNNYIWLGVG